MSEALQLRVEALAECAQAAREQYGFGSREYKAALDEFDRVDRRANPHLYASEKVGDE